METLEITLALLLAVAAIGVLARWVPLPVPLLLVAAGIVLSFMPLLGGLRIDPAIFFALFIPPLLFADGWLMPKRDFLVVLALVLMLAFGLVFLTVVAIGYLFHWLIPSLPLAAAFALGAIVSPTDAVATAATTARLPVPSSVTSILNGESLINDASGLVAFKFAAAAVATGMFSLSEAAEQFVLLAGGGAVAGLVVAFLIGGLRVRLRKVAIEDPVIQTILSLLTLLVNGLTLPLLIRFLGVHGDGSAAREERAARIALAHAGCSTLRESLPRLKRAEEVALAQRLVDSYERVLTRLSANAARRADLDALAASERRLMLAALRAERAELLEMRDAGIINDETMRAIEAEIDDAESSLLPHAARGHG